MLLLKYVVRLVRLLNSETSATALGLALGLGMVLGLVPVLTLQWFAVLAVVLFFRVNLTAALFTFAAFRLASIPCGGAFDRAGCALLEAPALAGLWTWMTNAPVLWLCGVNHSITLGATVAALVLFAPVFLVARALVNLYRDRFNEWWTQLGFVSAFRASRLYRLYEWIDAPFRGAP